MRRHLLTLVLTGVFGAFALVSDASACHKKKCAPAPACAPAPVVCAAPAPVVCEPAPAKKCCFKKAGGHKLFAGGFCHKKKVCAEPVVVACPAPAPMVVPSAQAAPSGQS